MNEISPHIGREQVLEIAGRKWKLSRWERRIWWELLQWARPQIPDPVETIAKHLDKLPDKLASYAVDKALAASRTFLSVNSPEVDSLLESLEGMVKVLHLLLLEHQPSITEDEAYCLAMHVAKTDPVGKDGKKKANRLQEIFAIALGKGPPSSPPSEPEGNAFTVPVAICP